MATNSITVWATSQTAQLQDEAQYKRDAELGIRPGIADLEQANMSWHQTTLVCAAVGEVVATDADGYTGVDFDWQEKVKDLGDKIRACINYLAKKQAELAIIAAKLVTYGSAQNLTGSEKSQARDNIDAAPRAAIKALCDEIIAAKGA